jgi:predicted ATPase
MIKNLVIRNFKAIQELSLNFTPLTVLIGENSCGKSTVLQALDLLRSITFRDIDEYLNDRGWEFNEIRSQFASPEENVSFHSEFCLEEQTILWDIAFNYDNEMDRWIIREKITDRKTGELYLSFGNKQIDNTPDIPFDFSQLHIKSSALKVLDTAAGGTIKYSSVLRDLQGLLAASRNYEILSPDKMRSNGNNDVLSKHKMVINIGTKGENLSSHIHGMSQDCRDELNKTISEFIGNEVEITTAEKSDWVEMYLEEKWKRSPICVEKRYISDGLLRIIALTAILIMLRQRMLTPVPFALFPRGIIMLDEIEDGINPSLAEKLMMRFKRASVDFKQQFVITSHSPIMVSFVDASDIQFMWRDQSGSIHSKPLFQTKQMMEALDFLNPGEVWLNYSKESIVEKLLGAEGNA